MAGSIYTFVGVSDPRNNTAELDTAQGPVKLGQSGLFLASEVTGLTGESILLTAGPAVSPASQLAAPTVAVGSAGLLTGAYKYVVTFVTAAGETQASAEASITLASQQCNLTNLPLGNALSGVTARKIYRTVAAGATRTEHLVTTINDNTTTIYTDNVADGSLGAAVPTVDTAGVISTGSIASQTPIYLNAKVKAGAPVDGDYTSPTDGLLVVDTVGIKIWARVGGVWKGVVIS